MKFSKYHLVTKNQIFSAAFIIFAMLIMIFPALANSSSWSFTGITGGNVVNGKVNGVFHTMTAGTLIYSGSLVTASIANPSTPIQTWTLQVRRKSTDAIVCQTTDVPSNAVGGSAPFNKNCGSISADTYYLYMFRNQYDGRIINGSGTLQT